MAAASWRRSKRPPTRTPISTTDSLRRPATIPTREATNRLRPPLSRRPLRCGNRPSDASTRSAIVPGLRSRRRLKPRSRRHRRLGMHRRLGRRRQACRSRQACRRRQVCRRQAWRHHHPAPCLGRRLRRHRATHHHPLVRAARRWHRRLRLACRAGRPDLLHHLRLACRAARPYLRRLRVRRRRTNSRGSWESGLAEPAGGAVVLGCLETAPRLRRCCDIAVRVAA